MKSLQEIKRINANVPNWAKDRIEPITIEFYTRDVTKPDPNERERILARLLEGDKGGSR